MQIGQQVRLSRRYSRGSFKWHDGLEPFVGMIGVISEINRSTSCPMIKVDFPGLNDKCNCWIHLECFNDGPDVGIEPQKPELITFTADTCDDFESIENNYVQQIKNKKKKVPEPEINPYDEFKDPNELFEYSIEPINWRWLDATTMTFFAKDDKEALREASVKYSMGKINIHRITNPSKDYRPASIKKVGTVENGKIIRSHV